MGRHKTFYEAKTPEEALEIYLRNDSDLYGIIKNENIEKILYSIVALKNSSNVLEVGAGGGTWTDFFIKKGANVVCIDTCKQILKGNAKSHPEARFIFADATIIKLNEKFDLIFAKDVIEHIKDDMKFLQNMNKHLKDGGLMLITTQNSFSLNYIVEGFWNFIRGDKKWCGWDHTHLRFYNSKTLRKNLEKAGFGIQRWFGCYYFPYKFVTGLVYGIAGKEYKEPRCKILHFVELLNLCDKWPFNIIGWSIGVVVKK